MLFHLSFHNKDQTKMFTIYKIYSKGNLFSIFFLGGGGGGEGRGCKHKFYPGSTYLYTPL